MNLDVAVTRIPSDAEVSSQLEAMVVALSGGTTVEERYRRFHDAPAPCPRRQPAEAIVAVGTLNSPDQVEAAGTRIAPDAFRIALDVRRFDGPLAANDPWTALVSMALGSLEAGSYTLVVQESVSRFTEHNRPETATGRETTEHAIAFECV